MKIKTKKKFKLDELIKYVWENDIRSETLESKFGVEVRFGGNQAVIMNHPVGIDDTFTVEVEEELTNRTKLPDLVIVYNDNFIITDSDECISEYINDYDNESVSNRMYVPYKGGLKLVWSRKNGIPKHGTLELSE